MDNEQLETEQPKEPYRERPTWKIWGARIGLIIMIICVILYYWQIASGGMR